ncbi:MAG: hypothetical protein ABI779_07700 [Acidobacteriota bacterium]
MAVLVTALCSASRAGAQSFTSTQCASQGGFCDASNTCVRYDPLESGLLQESTLGNCEAGIIIIITEAAAIPRLLRPPDRSWPS